MADVNLTLRGKFDQDEITSILNAMEATSFSSNDKIHIHMTGRRAEINNFFFRKLAKEISDRGITLAEGVLGTKQSEFATTVYNAGAGLPEGIAYSEIDNSLWIVDNALQKLVNTELDGALKSDFLFSAFGGVGTFTDVAIDDNGDLYAVGETGPTIYKLDDTGTFISSFLTSKFDVDASSPGGLTYSNKNDSLWYSDLSSQRIYNIDTLGLLKSSFPVSKYNENAISPKGISEHNNKLWISDTESPSTIYNVTTSGNLIDTFLTIVYDAGANDPTGITNAPDGTLWIAESGTVKIYNVAGTTINSLLNNGTIVIHSDNGFNKRINN